MGPDLPSNLLLRWLAAQVHSSPHTSFFEVTPPLPLPLPLLTYLLTYPHPNHATHPTTYRLLSCSAAQLLVATRSPDYQLPGGPPGSHSPPLSHIFLNNTGTPILITTTTYSLKPTLILPSILPVPKWVSSAPTLRSWFRTRMKSASIRFHIP